MTSVEECVIVIDGANVACQKEGKAYIPKLASCIQYFQLLETEVGRPPIKCVAFAPNFWLNVKPVPDKVGVQKHETMDARNWDMLKDLVQKDYVVLTPSQAHDDFYVIDYAVKYNGFIVTNDMFRDHVSNKRLFHGRVLTSNWVRLHCIDFTFVGEEFMPNPRAMERVFDVQSLTRESFLSSASSFVSGSTSMAALPHTNIQKTLSTHENDEESTNNDVDEDGMVVDHTGTKRSKNIDLSEVTYYKMPRQLLPMLHGQDGETMEKFQEYTGTYIVLPSHAISESLPTRSTMSTMLILSIYGPETSRQQAVGHLNAFLLQMQQKQEHVLYQQHLPSQDYQTEMYSQQPLQYIPADGNMPPQDDQMMEIDP